MNYINLRIIITIIIKLSRDVFKIVTCILKIILQISINILKLILNIIYFKTCKTLLCTLTEVKKYTYYLSLYLNKSVCNTM